MQQCRILDDQGVWLHDGFAQSYLNVVYAYLKHSYPSTSSCDTVSTAENVWLV